MQVRNNQCLSLCYRKWQFAEIWRCSCLWRKQQHTWSLQYSCQFVDWSWSHHRTPRIIWTFELQWMGSSQLKPNLCLRWIQWRNLKWKLTYEFCHRTYFFHSFRQCAIKLICFQIRKQQKPSLSRGFLEPTRNRAQRFDILFAKRGRGVGERLSWGP